MSLPYDYIKANIADIIVSHVDNRYRYHLIMKEHEDKPYYLTLDLEDGTTNSIAFHRSVVQEII